jgi:hypothetical protein
VALILRMITVIFAFTLASFGAAAVLTLGQWTAEGDPFDAYDQVAVGLAVAISAAVIAGYALLPGMLLIALAEGFRLRSIVFYALAGGFAALLIASGSSAPTLSRDLFSPEQELIAASGILAGLLYWALAGRKAGVWRDGRSVLPNSGRVG